MDVSALIELFPTTLITHLTPEEQSYVILLMAGLGGLATYTLVKKPELVPQTIAATGEVVKGIGEVFPL